MQHSRTDTMVDPAGWIESDFNVIGALCRRTVYSSTSSNLTRPSEKGHAESRTDQFNSQPKIYSVTILYNRIVSTVQNLIFITTVICIELTHVIRKYVKKQH